MKNAFDENNKIQICIVGAAIMDLMGFTQHDIKISDSVPGTWKAAPGGVGRNIAENLARLNTAPQLITAFGNDPFSETLVRNAEEIGIDLSGSLHVPEGKAATFIAILDKKNDLHTAIASLQIIQQLDVPFLKTRQKQLEEADIIIADTNIPKESLEWLVNQFFNTPIYLDLVSMKLAEKVKPFYGKFHTIKANRLEAEFLTGLLLDTEEDFKLAAEKMLSKGLKRIFITAGIRGVYYADDTTNGWLKPFLVEVQNTTGAGDAFMAGVTYGSSKGYSIRECAARGLAAAAIALKSTKAVNPEINETHLMKYLKMTPNY